MFLFAILLFFYPVFCGDFQYVSFADVCIKELMHASQRLPLSPQTEKKTAKAKCYEDTK
jgi:hypothetical protein